ncbi:MAG: hypothetical protein M1824_003195 [Vezdaea acicularis]|nr:MAG: hypothetical protein M1824_003195 [Vezdaea acicularis]
MPPTKTEPSTNEKSFVLAALSSRLRLDGRDPLSYRQLSISFPSTYGSVDLSLGKTRILTSTHLTLAAPHPLRPLDGLFTISLQLSPQTSPSYPAHSTSHTQNLSPQLTRLLEKSLIRAPAISTESLCLLAGQRVWSLTLTIHILSDSGNLPDAIGLAAIATLLHARLPVTEVRGGEVTLWSVRERVPQALGVLRVPITITFTFIQPNSPDAAAPDPSDGMDDEAAATPTATDQQLILLDATPLEESVSVARLSVTATAQGEVVGISLLGGGPVEAVLLLRCAELAVRKAGELTGWLRGEVDRDLERRDGVVVREGGAENER